MKIQRPSYEIWLQKPGELGIYQQIERAGRVCYKSENNTTEESAKPFVERMMQSEHFAMLGMEPCIWYATMESCRFIPTTSSHV